MGAPEILPSQPLHVTLALDHAMAQHLASANAIVAEAESLEVDSLPMAEYANGFLRELKAKKTRIEQMHDDIVNPVKLALANAKKWFTPSIDAHDQAERIVKGKLADFTRKEAERVAAERRAQEEAARQRREQAERDAAAAQARAAAAAAESRRKAAEAAEKERQALAAGNARAAAAAAAERAKQEEAERQKIAEGERKAAEAQLAAAAAPVVEVREAEKIAGFSMRSAWEAERTAPDDATAIRLIAEAICGVRVADSKAVLTGTQRHDLIALLKIDTAAANRLAKALKGSFNVPGFRAVDKPVPVSRAK